MLTGREEADGFLMTQPKTQRAFFRRQPEYKFQSGLGLLPLTSEYEAV